jgi:activator of HSP90 ATPase
MTDGGNFAVPGCAPTRRQLIASTAAVFVSSLIGSGSARAGTEEKISHAAEAIHQETLFKASRKRLYDALTDDKQFDKVMHLSAAMQSGMALGNSPTEISRDVGGPFTLYGGHILGRHIELVPNERIVQAWRVATWSPGVYSIAKFELTEQGSDTKLVFDHAGFPVGQAQHLAEGWKSNYWEPLAKFLA